MLAFARQPAATALPFRLSFLDNALVDLQLLREETRTEHELTETLFPFQGQDLDRPHYVQTLQCIHRFVQGWEDWASCHAPDRLIPLLQERTRVPLLLRDLSFFGASPLPGDNGSPALLDSILREEKNSLAYEASFLGSMYVLEGSTLGGQYIARQVEQAMGLVPGEGDAYFRGYGEQTGSMWNAFRQLLLAIPEQNSGTVIAAAKATFAYVQETMRSCSLDLAPLTKSS